jgi:chromosomal replication initiator protein
MSLGEPGEFRDRRRRNTGTVPDAVSEDLAAIWQRVRDELRASLPPSTFDLWVEPLQAVASRGTTLYVRAPETIRSWVDRRYGTRLAEALRNCTPSLREVHVVSAPAQLPVEAESPPGPGAVEPPLNPSHSFDRFVIGDGNRFAHAAALAVAELPGDSYNPLFLHGSPGLGKTHLLGAIASYLARHHQELTVRYTTGERFTAEFVAALRESSAERFKERHRDIDVLLIDDVDFLEDKARTEEEFFHTFNALHEGGSQIVLSSDRPPQELSRLAERLRDRFEWGLCAELEPPDLPTRIALLWRLVSEGPLESIATEILRELAAEVPGNVRRLEGALTRVTAVASLTSRPIDRELIREVLGGKSGGTSSPTPRLDRAEAPSVAAIQDAVCAVLHLSRQELLSSSRTPRVARARQLAMYLSRDMTDRSVTQIARDFNRDHSTVLHAVRRISANLTPDSELYDSANQARALLQTN